MQTDPQQATTPCSRTPTQYHAQVTTTSSTAQAGPDNTGSHGVLPLRLQDIRGGTGGDHRSQKT
eukprot:1486445-Pyramimonas_sp.AAC.1